MRRLTVPLAMLVLATMAMVASPVAASDQFDDVATGHTFHDDIAWLADSGITKGCNPPANTLFCPDDPVTRGQMAAFLVRALDLPPAGDQGLTDTAGSVFEADIDALAAAGITKGCNPPANTRFCPNDEVTRAQMAAFLVRALDLPAAGDQGLTDTAGSVFKADIDALAAAGITKGCDPPANTMFCPNDEVTRAQMAAFLVRALDGGTGAPGFLYFSYAHNLRRYDIATHEDAFLQALPGSDSGAFITPDGSMYTSTRNEGDEADAHERVYLSRLRSQELVTQFEFPGRLRENFNPPDPANEGVQAAGIRPSPGGRYFSGVVRDPPFNEVALLRVTNRTGGVVFEWGTEKGTNQIRGHDWSPDGSLVVTGIIGGTPAMGIIEDVTEPNTKPKVVRTFQQAWQHIPDQMAVSHDGARVAYALNGNIWMGSLVPGASDHRLIITGTGPIHRPAFSPDGRRMAVTLQSTPLGGDGHLHIVDIPSTGTVSLSNATAVPDQNGLQVRAGGFWSAVAWFDGE